MPQQLRIVSLVPSLTETVASLGFKDAIVGCTQFCVKPAGLHKTAALIGGTKNPDLSAIAALQPTHILTNDEENKPEHIAACEGIATTLRTFPRSPSDMPEMLRGLGEGLGQREPFAQAARDVEVVLASLEREQQVQSPWLFPVGRRFLYFIWREPYMVAARDTYISRLLEVFGFDNACGSATRYPEVTLDEIKAAKADVIFLSSEPYPFRARDAARMRAAWPDAPSIWRIDGQLMSWHGTLTLEALREMKKWRDGLEQVLTKPI